jgi:PD-(D/E)XK endonuclease
MRNGSRDTRKTTQQPSAQAPRRHLGKKRMGEVAELAFMHKAATLGFGVAKPYGDSHPYDLLLQHGRRLLRIQVKSVFAGQAKNRWGYAVNVSQHRNMRCAFYSEDDIDFLAAYVAVHDAWYVIPVQSVSTRKAITLFPAGKKKKTAGLFEQFREAWHLLKDNNEEDG